MGCLNFARIVDPAVIVLAGGPTKVAPSCKVVDVLPCFLSDYLYKIYRGVIMASPLAGLRARPARCCCDSFARTWPR